MCSSDLANEGVEHIRSLENAKEAWDHLIDMYDGNINIQGSKKFIMQRQVDNFIMKDGEIPEDMFRRLKALVVDMRDCGFKDCDEDWVKEKFLQALIPYNEHMVMNVQSRADFLDLSPSDVLGVFITMNTMKKSSEDTIARANGMKRASLALQATSQEETSDDDASTYVASEKEKRKSHSECLDLANHNWWMKGDYRSNATFMDLFIPACTHYIFLKEAIRAFFINRYQNDIHIVNVPQLVTEHIKHFLQKNHLNNHSGDHPTPYFMATKSTPYFIKTVDTLFNQSVSLVTL